MELFELFPGLFPASFRGVEFHMPDSRHEVGRRVQRFLFPGRDSTIDEDLGALDGPITVSGLVLGPDYIAQARRLERAFRAEGPGLLAHPWLGELAVTLASPATFTFDERKLRVASFEVSFQIWEERQFPAADTLGLLLDDLALLRAEARAMMRQVLQPLSMPLAAISAVRSYSVGAVSTWRGLLAGGSGVSALAEEAGVAIAGLAALQNIPVRTTLPDEVTDAVQGVPRAVARRAAIAPLPAIGSAGPPTPPPPAPELAATLLLDAASRFPRPATPAPAPALALATRLATIAEAVEVGAAIAFDSQPQARAWQARMDAAIAAAAADAAALAATLPLAAGPTWRATGALRRSFATDMSARIGRLPEVLDLTVPGPAAAWVIAQHIAGDAPASVQATLIDILRRNRIRAPGMVAPGRLEILRPTLAAWRVVDGPRAPEEVAASSGGLFILDVSRLDVDRLG
jgi:prophage DNA circulation protein